MKTKIHVKDQYCAGPNCDCGYKSDEVKHTEGKESVSKHTPTPWVVDGRVVVGQRMEQEVAVCPYDRKEDEVYITEDEAYANAALIVRAVNSYEALLEAAKDMRSRLANIEWETEEDKQFALSDWDKAIAQAEGK